MGSSKLDPVIQIHKAVQQPSLHESLKGKVALVTESSYGIGRQIAHALAHAGARVAISGRKESDVLDTAKEISVYGPKTIGVVTNILSKTDTKKLVQEVSILASVADFDHANIPSHYRSHPDLVK